MIGAMLRLSRFHVGNLVGWKAHCVLTIPKDLTRIEWRLQCHFVTYVGWLVGWEVQCLRENWRNGLRYWDTRSILSGTG